MIKFYFYLLHQKIENNNILKMNPISRQKKRSSLSSYVNKELLNFKLFPLPSTRDNLQKYIETYSSFSRQQIKKILTELIEIKKFKQLVCNNLQLQYLYHPIISILQEEYDWAGQKIKINQIFQILIQGKFFRKLPKQGQIFLVNNTKNTQTNVSCIIAALLVYISGRLSFTQIQRILKVFEYEEKLSQTQSLGISIQYQKILKIIKKLQRKVKPLEFKQWIEDFKKVTKKQKIENFHFLYLASLSEAKKDQNSYAFMDLNFNKDKRNRNQQKKIQQGQNGIQNEKKDQNHNYRIKSFSYKQNRSNLPVIAAFKEIKTHLNVTQQKLKEKRKSMSLLSRIKNKFQLGHDEEIFRQIHFTQNSKNQELNPTKNPNIQKNIVSQRKKRGSSVQGNAISRILTCEQSREVYKNKENQIIPSQICRNLLKQKLTSNFPNNKTKKLSLNREQQKLSLNFANVFDYHEKKIQNEIKNIRAHRQ